MEYLCSSLIAITRWILWDYKWKLLWITANYNAFYAMNQTYFNKWPAKTKMKFQPSWHSIIFNEVKFKWTIQTRQMLQHFLINKYLTLSTSRINLEWRVLMLIFNVQEGSYLSPLSSCWKVPYKLPCVGLVHLRETHKNAWSLGTNMHRSLSFFWVALFRVSLYYSYISLGPVLTNSRSQTLFLQFSQHKVCIPKP